MPGQGAGRSATGGDGDGPVVGARDAVGLAEGIARADGRPVGTVTPAVGAGGEGGGGSMQPAISAARRTTAHGPRRRPSAAKKDRSAGRVDADWQPGKRCGSGSVDHCTIMSRIERGAMARHSGIASVASHSRVQPACAQIASHAPRVPNYLSAR